MGWRRDPNNKDRWITDKEYNREYGGISDSELGAKVAMVIFGVLGYYLATIVSPYVPGTIYRIFVILFPIIGAIIGLLISSFFWKAVKWMLILGIAELIIVALIEYIFQISIPPDLKKIVNWVIVVVAIIISFFSLMS